MIEAAIYSLLSTDVTVSGLAGTRIYPNDAPQSATVPYIVYDQIGGSRDYSFDGSIGLVDGSWQISCFAVTPLLARTLSDAVINVVDAYSGTVDTTVIKLIEIEGEGDIPYLDNELESQKVYGKRLDIRIIYAE
jgi:hypothetical protein